MTTARYTKKDRMLDFYRRFADLGFERHETDTLRRIEMTLRRWHERECGTGNDRVSISVERDDENSAYCTQCGEKWFGETALTHNCPKCGDCAPIRHKATNKTFERRQFWAAGKWQDVKFPCADKETGARKRLAKIMGKHPDLWFFVQTDPRGCALYIVPASVLPDVADAEIVRHSGPTAVKSAESRLDWALSCYYTRGFACNY